jgi:alginate O-acetyltransferase complex protein AlgI
MVIPGYAFLLLFLPISLALYWLIVRQPVYKLWFLCIISYLFYAFGGIEFIPLLLGLSLATFLLAQWNRAGWAIALNLAALGVFKYWNFGADNLNALGEIVGLSDGIPLMDLALPLGISFYVFKHVGYLIDVRNGRYPATRDFLAFTTYSAFFPQISAGPISSFDDTGAQLRNLTTSLNSNQAYQGMIHISMGLAKKLLIADALASALQTGLYDSATAGSGFMWAWLSVAVYALQLYFDFSGYTDTVLGVGYLFGITLPPNFNNPYLADNPSQFWQRWHMSLSLWFRLYLFTPISRNLIRRWGMRRVQVAQYAANMITMLLIGLWHGAGWGFILWGGFHGLLLNAYAWVNRRKLGVAIPYLGQAVFIVAVLIGWALFLSPDLTFAGDLFKNMTGLNGIGSLNQIKNLYNGDTMLIFLVAASITLSGMTEAANLPKIRRPEYAFLFGVLAVLSILHIGESAVEFVYVQF